MERTASSDVQRVDGIDKVSGKAIYAADRNLPRMAYALPVIATIGKGQVRRIHTAKAEESAGVILVLTHLNMDRLKPLQFLFAGGHGSQSLQPMQSDAIAYRGQPVALVVANSLEAAQAASRLIEVEYVAAPFDVELDSKGGEAVAQAVAAPYFPDIIVADADRALSAAEVVVDTRCTTPPQHHNAMELLSTVIEWQGDQLIIHEGTQASQTIARGLALQLDMDPAKIRVMSPYVGGAFGGRNSIAPHTVLAAVVARRLRRPVKLVLPRDQGFYDIHFRPASAHHLRLGADKTGKFTTAVHEVKVQTSRFDLFPFTGAETIARMYGFPAFRGSTTLVKLDTQTPGFMRAPFEMSSCVALESAIDELSYRLGIDPVALRLANDTQTDPITRKPFSSRNLAECLRRGAQKFGWENRSPRPGSMRTADGTLIGWGVACGAYPGYIVPTIATVRIKSDGKAEVWVGGHEMGQGIRTTIALVAADELGLQPQQVNLVIGDTIAPPQHITAGSWGTATAAPAVMKAARDVRDRLFTLATTQAGSPLQGAKPADLALRNGAIESKDGRRVTYSALLARSGQADVVGSTQWYGPGQKPDVIERAKQGVVAAAGPEFPDFVAFSFIAHFVEVRINPLIPRPRVARVVSVTDCGRVISRRTASSQVYGGLVWGIGAALSEASEVDARFGGFLNTNIAEYAIPVNADMGRFEVDFIDSPDLKFNPSGARGLGEVASVGAAAAIVNAVYHATGKRIQDLPIRIENLL